MSDTRVCDGCGISDFERRNPNAKMCIEVHRIDRFSGGDVPVAPDEPNHYCWNCAKKMFKGLGDPS